jgi:hypothetical protein
MNVISFWTYSHLSTCGSKTRLWWFWAQCCLRKQVKHYRRKITTKKKITINNLNNLYGSQAIYTSMSGKSYFQSYTKASWKQWGSVSHGCRSTRTAQPNDYTTLDARRPKNRSQPSLHWLFIYFLTYNFSDVLAL